MTRDKPTKNDLKPKFSKKAKKAAQEAAPVQPTILDEKAESRRDLWAGRLLLLMVLELHRRGFERLRIAPYLSPSGAYWRCRFVPRAATTPHHGAIVSPDYKERPNVERTYTSGAKFEFFDWGDCSLLTPADLADRFEQSFRDILDDCRGEDSEYAAWYRQMLFDTAPLGLPFSFADWETPEGMMEVGGECGVKLVGVPPISVGRSDQ